MEEKVFPADAAGDFNQSLIELGAIVCVPNGEPKCGECPVSRICLAHARGREMEFPVKKKAKSRRIEKRTILVFRDNEKTAVRKRPDTGLLAGMYEFPGREGHLKQAEVIEYAKGLGLMPVRVKRLGKAKHIFSHVEWHMVGSEVIVDELEKNMKGSGKKRGQDKGKSAPGEILFAGLSELKEHYPMPSAFEAYMPEV